MCKVPQNVRRQSTCSGKLQKERRFFIGSSIITIVIALIVFGVVVLIHELGHFLTAKACGITVNEFSIGMGPRLFGFSKNGTDYSTRLLPIDGYVTMEG